MLITGTMYARRTMQVKGKVRGAYNYFREGLGAGLNYGFGDVDDHAPLARLGLFPDRP